LDAPNIAAVDARRNKKFAEQPCAACSTCDILDAYKACANLQDCDLRKLFDLGIGINAIAMPLALAKARVAFQGGHCFEFDAHAEMALILPCIEDGDLVDLVAWQPQASRLATWLGRAKALGWADLYSPSLTGEPVKVWASPVGWLKAGRRGLVPIGVERMARSLFLWGDHVSALVCENPEHARAIKQAYSRKPPRVFVPKPELVEAA
jgi:hypothetical protein